jgi:hypothetical protein
VSPPVAAMIKDWPPRIEYARAAPCPVDQAEESRSKIIR